jgi:hypothetical protein
MSREVVDLTEACDGLSRKLHHADSADKVGLNRHGANWDILEVRRGDTRGKQNGTAASVFLDAARLMSDEGYKWQ